MDPLAPIEEAVRHTNAFVANLAEQGLHVGVNGRCVTCQTDWPCAIGNQALAALEVGQRFIVTKDLPATTGALEQAVAEGWMEHAGVDADGEQRYRMTPAGVAKVESMGAGTDDECSPPTG